MVELQKYTGEGKVVALDQDSVSALHLFRLTLRNPGQEAFDNVFPTTDAMIENGVGAGDMITFTYEESQPQKDGSIFYRGVTEIKRVRIAQ